MATTPKELFYSVLDHSVKLYFFEWLWRSEWLFVCLSNDLNTWLMTACDRVSSSSFLSMEVLVCQWRKVSSEEEIPNMC